MTKTRPEKISLRSKPCRCGCKGQDSWHKKSIRRIVEKTSDTTGIIKTPWGKIEVERKAYVSTITGSQVFGMWEKSKIES